MYQGFALAVPSGPFALGQLGILVFSLKSYA